jgi:hypothetical protein
MKAKVKVLSELPLDPANKELEVMFSTIKDLALQIIRESPNIPSEAQFAIGNIDSPTFLVNFISSNMNADVSKKQAMLEEMDMKKRVLLVLEHLTAEVQLLEMKNEIQNRVRKDLDKQQREYFLHQQMRTIQDELGDNPQIQDVRELEQRALTKKWDDRVSKLFQKELDKLQRMNPQGAEYTVQLNYLDLLLDLPWGEFTTDLLDLKMAKRSMPGLSYPVVKTPKFITALIFPSLCRFKTSSRSGESPVTIAHVIPRLTRHCAIMSQCLTLLANKSHDFRSAPSSQISCTAASVMAMCRSDICARLNSPATILTPCISACVKDDLLLSGDR